MCHLYDFHFLIEVLWEKIFGSTEAVYLTQNITVQLIEYNFASLFLKKNIPYLCMLLNIFLIDYMYICKTSIRACEIVGLNTIDKGAHFLMMKRQMPTKESILSILPSLLPKLISWRSYPFQRWRFLRPRTPVQEIRNLRK